MDQPSRDPRSSCSSAWNALSAWGTATRAGFWVALEQPGPWGRDALTQSHLDRALGARLNASSAGAGGRVLLIRAPGAHSDRTGTAKRRVFVAGALAGRPWLLSGHVEDPAELEALPWHALSTSSADAVLASLPWLRPTGEPVLLLCTNSKLDVCCALQGRPVAHAVALQRPGQVWECSTPRRPGSWPWGRSTSDTIGASATSRLRSRPPRHGCAPTRGSLIRPP